MSPQEEEPSKILVVDDDEAIRRLFQNMLESSGYEVDVAQDAAEAYRLINGKPYDAAFVDIFIPDDRDIFIPSDSGIDVLQKLRMIQPNTPAVIFTGMPTVQTAADALRFGAYDYLTKPVNLTVLISTATRAVETKRLRDEKKRLEKENLEYQRNLEDLVEERTLRLRQQKEFLENILESLSHPFYVVDAHDCTIKIANSAADFGTITSRSTCYALTHGTKEKCGTDEQRCILEEVKESGESAMAEHEHVDREGRPSIVEVHGYPVFDEKGGLAQVIFYSMDISERKRLESVAAAKNLMENIGYVFSGIRHEIGNPINSLKTGLTVLAKGINSIPKKEIKEYVQDALAETARVEYLLRALKNFSLFESPEIEDLDLVEFMDGMRSLFGEDLEKRGIALETHIPSRPCRGRVDSRALHHVMLNLFSNALDALKGRENPRLLLSMQRGSGVIQVEFSDNGRGMTVEEQANLFKPFYTTKYDGTGLGLVMVRKMLTEMNCSIQISSRKNHGTTVVIGIPEGGNDSRWNEKNTPGR